MTDVARRSCHDRQHNECDQNQDENYEPVVEAGIRRLVSALARARCATGDDSPQEVHAVRLLATVRPERDCRRLGGLSDRCLNIAPADNGSGRHRPLALSGGLFVEVVTDVLVVLLTAEVPEAVVFGLGEQGWVRSPRPVSSCQERRLMTLPTTEKIETSMLAWARPV